MSNVLAIAQKELKSYFASPIAYIIIGFFALVFGWFFFVSLTFFMQASLQMGMPGQGQVNINNMAIGVIAVVIVGLGTYASYRLMQRRSADAAVPAHAGDQLALR